MTVIHLNGAQPAQDEPPHEPPAAIPFPSPPGRPSEPPQEPGSEPQTPEPVPQPAPEPAPEPTPAAASLDMRALRDLAEMNRKLSLEGAACLVDILANAVERAPDTRITRATMTKLLRDVAVGIRDLKCTGRLD
ncbi:MAG TPA: hypothetical protein VGF29_05880 [Hyphomicrobiaceae bacterium]|jgi:hypothetical protein